MSSGLHGMTEPLLPIYTSEQREQRHGLVTRSCFRKTTEITMSKVPVGGKATDLSFEITKLKGHKNLNGKKKCGRKKYFLLSLSLLLMWTSWVSGLGCYKSLS